MAGVFILSIACALVSFAQEDKPAAKQNTRDQGVAEGPAHRSESTPEAVLYTYEFTQAEFFIRHIVIEHDSDGRGKIKFERKNETAALEEPIELSQLVLARIVSHWRDLNFLQSDASYQASKQFPHLGTMQLSMRLGAQQRSAEFELDQ
ncbi:MAG: hypothetical protein WKF84_20205 [Pyrinomonadaceae bacterium]